MNATKQRYEKARGQTAREFSFWAGILATPAHLRTRAQRKHVQTRQSRGRIVALETLIRGGMRPANTAPGGLAPTTREQRKATMAMINEHTTALGNQ